MIKLIQDQQLSKKWRIINNKHGRNRLKLQKCLTILELLNTITIYPKKVLIQILLRQSILSRNLLEVKIWMNTLILLVKQDKEDYLNKWYLNYSHNYWRVIEKFIVKILFIGISNLKIYQWIKIKILKLSISGKLNKEN